MVYFRTPPGPTLNKEKVPWLTGYHLLNSRGMFRAGGQPVVLRWLRGKPGPTWPSAISSCSLHHGNRDQFRPVWEGAAHIPPGNVEGEGTVFFPRFPDASKLLPRCSSAVRLSGWVLGMMGGCWDR